MSVREPVSNDPIDCNTVCRSRTFHMHIQTCEHESCTDTSVHAQYFSKHGICLKHRWEFTESPTLSPAPGCLFYTEGASFVTFNSCPMCHTEPQFIQPSGASIFLLFQTMSPKKTVPVSSAGMLPEGAFITIRLLPELLPEGSATSIPARSPQCVTRGSSPWLVERKPVQGHGDRARLH